MRRGKGSSCSNPMNERMRRETVGNKEKNRTLVILCLSLFMYTRVCLRARVCACVYTIHRQAHGVQAVIGLSFFF